MNLRTRLMLTFLAVVFLLAVGNLITFYINRGIQHDVSRLNRSPLVELRQEDLGDRALEIEGRWQEEGAFIATKIERLSTGRRPKLRGGIQTLDRGNNTINVFGVPIAVGDETVFLDGGDFSGLETGQRVEVSCTVDSAGHWTARKIKVRGLKRSDKVKGNVTHAAMDGTPPDTLNISGLTVLVVRKTAADTPQEGLVRVFREAGNPQSHLGRMEKAMRMTLAIQTCRTAAQDLLKEKYRVVSHAETGDARRAEQAKGLAADAALELQQEYEEFERFVREARIAARDAAGGTPQRVNGQTELELWLDPLAAMRATFGENVTRFLELAAGDLHRADTFLREVLEPQVRDDMLPLLQAYQEDAEEALVAEVKAISARAGTSTRLGIAANVVALLAALLLGLAVSRHISRPILELKEAALKIGSGHLDTRVDIRSKDELGVLATSFNRMAEELTETTLSKSNLANVIDSMAGALIIVSPDGEITSVNQAAGSLLGYEKEELVGEPFTRVCPGESGESERIVATGARGIVANVEKVFRAKNGTSIPVSFSGAALRSEGGPVQGFVCIAQDLTERKRIEEQIRQSLSEKELLLHELHHRVKNNLQVISSLLDLQSSFVKDPDTREKFQESQSRIRSMALIHEQLYHTTELNQIDFRTYLERLTAHLFDSFGVGRAIRLRLEVEELGLNLDQAVSCGLIVNELVTNALKHAFPDKANGEIVIVYCKGKDGGRILSVSDNGRGINKSSKPETSDSLGMSLVETLVKQLCGRLVFNHDNGTECRIEFPASGVGQGVLKT